MRGRDTLKDLYFRLLRLAGSDRRLLGNIRKQDLVVILNLHQVSPVSNPFWPPLDPQVFDELLRFLKKIFPFAPLPTWPRSATLDPVRCCRLTTATTTSSSLPCRS